jgi:hypothetical protein
MINIIFTQTTFKKRYENNSLNEKRQRELAQEKRALANGTIDAESRKENEMLNRTKYLRIIINGLTRLRWPPALEAFSDPLHDLMNDRDTFISALLYIHKVAVAPLQGIDAYVRKHSNVNEHEQQQHISNQAAQAHGSPHSRNSNSNSPSKRRIPRSARGSGDANSGDSSSDEDPNDNRSVGVMSGVNVSGVDSANTSFGDISISKLDLSLSGSVQGQRQGQSNTSRSSSNSHLNSINNTSRTNTSIRSPRGGNGYSDDVTGGAPMTDANLNSIIKVLQSQNENLTSQLHSMVMSQNAKYEVEKRTEGILLDIVQAVGEVCNSFGNGDGNGNENGKGGTKGIVNSVVNNSYIAGISNVDGDLDGDGDSSFITQEEDQAFQQEVLREKKGQMRASAANNANKIGMNQGRSSNGKSSTSNSSSISNNNNGSSNNKRVTSSLIWSQVHSQLKSLAAQWTGAKEEARKASVRYIHEARQKRKQNTGNSNSSKTSMSSARGRGIDSPAMHRTMGIVHPLWKQNENTNSGMHDNDNDNDTSFIFQSGSTKPSVHQLQRDLIDFAQAATSFSYSYSFSGNENENNDDNNINNAFVANFDPLPFNKVRDGSQRSKETMGIGQTVLVLRKKARELALHLAAHGFIPALDGSDGSDISSSNSNSSGSGKYGSTSVEILLREVEDLVASHSSIKRDPTKWKSILTASETVSNEILQLHSYIRSLDKQQQKQNSASEILTNLLNQFMKNSQKVLRNSFDPLKPFMESTTSILTLLHEAENSTIVDKGGNGSRMRPLDMLCRGYLGEPVSSLVTGLRLHSKNLAALDSSLRDLHRDMHQSALKELNSLETAKTKALASLSSHVLVSSVSSNSSSNSNRHSDTNSDANGNICHSRIRERNIKNIPRSPDPPNVDYGEHMYRQVRGEGDSSTSRHVRSPVTVGNTNSNSNSNKGNELNRRPAFDNSISTSRTR